MVVTVYREAVTRRYRAPWFSLSCLFNLLVIIGILLVPLFVGLASGNFWLKRNLLYEQPNIQFSYDLVVVLQGYNESTTDRKGITWVWATNAKKRAAYEPYVRSPVIRAWKEDDNGDDVADTWHLTIQMPLQSSDRIHNVQMTALFDYGLSGPAKLYMDGIAYIEQSNAIAGLGLLVETEARLHQRRIRSAGRPLRRSSPSSRRSTRRWRAPTHR